MHFTRVDLEIFEQGKVNQVFEASGLWAHNGEGGGGGHTL